MKRPLHKIGIPTLFVCIVLFSFCMKPINVSADYETPGNFSTTFPQNQKLFHVEGGSLLLSTDGANYTKSCAPFRPGESTIRTMGTPIFICIHRCYCRRFLSLFARGKQLLWYQNRMAGYGKASILYIHCSYPPYFTSPMENLR